MILVRQICNNMTVFLQGKDYLQRKYNACSVLLQFYSATILHSNLVKGNCNYSYPSVFRFLNNNEI